MDIPLPPPHEGRLAIPIAHVAEDALGVRAADPDEIEAQSALLDSADAGLFMPGE